MSQNSTNDINADGEQRRHWRGRETFAREEAAETTEYVTEEVEELRREVAKLHAGEDQLRRRRQSSASCSGTLGPSSTTSWRTLRSGPSKGPDEVAWTQVGHGGREVIDVTVGLRPDSPPSTSSSTWRARTSSTGSTWPAPRIPRPPSWRTDGGSRCRGWVPS